MLQNELISTFLAKETGGCCIPVHSLSDAKAHISGTLQEKALMLYDCMGKDKLRCAEKLISTFPRVYDEDPSRRLTCLFNVGRDSGGEEDCIAHGIKGLFYEGESLDNFANGVKAVLEGELWISRRSMARYICKNCHHTRKPRQKILSVRETHVLTMLASGATNEEIGNALCISRHTVKSHLYKIFKKINASSRFQAALWATKNL